MNTNRKLFGDDSPSHRLWRRLARPFDSQLVLETAFGILPEHSRVLVAVAVATSPAAEELLARMPAIARVLSSSVDSRVERCQGEVRGPILWGETVAARGASGGAKDVVVCAVPRRHFDNDENRVLVAALAALRDAAQAVSDLGPPIEANTRQRARNNGEQAARWLRHSQLAQVALTVPGPRQLRRTRSGYRRGVYSAAVRMLEWARHPELVDEARLRCGPTIHAEHDLLDQVIRQQEAEHGPLPGFRISHGVLRSGPVSYRHGPGATAGPNHGVRLHEIPVNGSGDDDPVPAIPVYESANWSG